MVKPAQHSRTPPRTVSMTGYAALGGADDGHDWSWEIRSVNGKGLDLRLRLPEIEGLEAAVRAAVSAVAARGNIQVNLKLVQREGAEALRLSPGGARAAVAAVIEIEEAARDRGLVLAPSRAADLLALRGVVDQSAPERTDSAPLRTALVKDLQTLLGDFAAMRAAEGAVIGGLIEAQIDRIAALTDAAETAAEARRPETEATLTAALARVMAGAPGADPQRVAQELAMLAVKADVTEEIDRLRAHVKAARALLIETAPVGRKFDFLTQEFVREANTLCSKSGSTRLTAIGLDLKAVIDQMREQIQNVE